MLLEPDLNLACEVGQRRHLAVLLPRDRPLMIIFPTCVVCLPRAPRATGICRQASWSFPSCSKDCE